MLHRRHRPLLDGSWLQWMAHNLLRRADHGQMLQRMAERGIAPLTARSAVAEIERDPVYLAASQLLAPAP